MNSEAPSVSVVIANFNGEHYLDGMMAALAATGHPFLEIIVSDDCSTDGSRLLLRHRYPEVRVATSSVNTGVAATRNRGLELASGELVLLLDNDGYPEPDCVDPLVAALMEDPGLVGVMPRIVLDGDPRLVHCDGSRTHYTGQMWLLNGHVPLDEAPREAEPLAGLMGTAMMFRREAAMAIGGFEPDYYFYFEDNDFGTRLRILQGRLRSEPRAHVRHLGGTKNLSFRSGHAYPRRRQHLIPRNRLYFTLRTFEKRTLFLFVPILLLQEVAQLAFAALRGWLEPVTGALFWNLSHLDRTLRKRDAIQSRRIAWDRDILEGGPLPLHPGVMKQGGLVARLRGGLEGAMERLYRLVRPFLARH